MNKVHRFIPLLAFCLYFGKSLTQQAGYPEAIMLLILGSIAAFYEYKNTDSKLVELEEKLNKLNQDNLEQNKEIENLKGSVSAVKLSTGMRGLGNGGR